MTRTLSVIIYLFAVAVLTTSVWYYSARQTVSALAIRGQSDLALASDRLVSGISGYRLLAVALARDPRLQSPETPRAELETVLRRAADLSGALDFVLLNDQRVVQAGASGSATDAWSGEPLISHALHGTLGTHLMFSEEFGRRTFLIATPVFGPAGPVRRVLVAAVDLERIEADFRGDRPAVFITDNAGTIYFTNRSELVLKSSRPGTGGVGRDDAGFLNYTPGRFPGAEIWTISAGRYLPRRALRVTQDLPVIGMRAEALVDVAPAFATAWLQAAVVGFAMLLFGAIFFLVTRQRRALAVANEALEGQVSARTRELSDANIALRAEVNERIEAEKALKQAQSDLIQAEKLSALGKMSAGISHELNQPLMAIQSFAENGALFLARGNAEKAGANLSRISDLAARMARIIRNFRAFARQEKETVNRVDLIKAVDAAVDLARGPLQRHGVDLTLHLPDDPLWVQGGEVRLQQVVLNLLSNAIDAMAAAPVRQIKVTAEPGVPVVLTVQDTGPGIADPDKVFEPFYSTKSIGEAEGVGLGLSISYGLVQSFGGNIRGTNAEGGGAIFTVELQQWIDEEAA